MPVHCADVDVVAEMAGIESVLIVPCNVCPAVSVAVDSNQPFMRLYRSALRSLPFEEHIEKLRSQLTESGVRSQVFKSRLYHHWFLCMWTSGRRRKLRRAARQHDAVVVLGCESATETVRDAVKPLDCKVIEGMKVVSFMNARLALRFPGRITFEDTRFVPFASQRNAEGGRDETETPVDRYAGSAMTDPTVG